MLHKIELTIPEEMGRRLYRHAIASGHQEAAAYIVLAANAQCSEGLPLDSHDCLSHVGGTSITYTISMSREVVETMQKKARFSKLSVECVIVELLNQRLAAIRSS